MPAASQPISFTSMKVLCCTLVMRVPMGESWKMLLKSAASENMALMPSCESVQELVYNQLSLEQSLTELTLFKVGFRSVSNSNLNLGK